MNKATSIELHRIQVIAVDDMFFHLLMTYATSSASIIFL